MIDDAGKKLIVTLRLLIARAAQKDSLKWWDDESLTPEGFFLLERLFSANPINAGKKLALEAASNRYHNALISVENALHLFRLDLTGEIEYSLHNVRLSEIQLHSDPIHSIDDLKHLLQDIIGQPPISKIINKSPSPCIEIGFDSSSRKISITEVAIALSSAVLEGQPTQPIFPYIRVNV